MGKSWLIAKPVYKAQTRSRLAPSHISRPLVWLGRILLPAYMRFALRFSGIEIRLPDRVVEVINDFQNGKTRLIIAFRHPYGDEPQLVFHVFVNLVRQYAKRLKVRLTRKSMIRLVHDYAVPLWGGAFIRYLLPRVGAVPVYHVRFDPKSLQEIRRMLKDDPCPVGLAPEGQISYHAETLPRIEQGTIHMGFWCATDMAKENRPEKVVVLPLSVFYRYDRRDGKKIGAAVTRLEAMCGLTAFDALPGKAAELLELLPRIDAIENRILEIAEAYYTKSYAFQPAAGTRHDRWMALLEAAMSQAERILGLDAGDDDIVKRMYRVRMEGWDRIYPEISIDCQNELERALTDRRAGEAWYAMRHMELVDLMSYHDDSYLRSGNAASPSYDRLVESVYTLEDLAARLMGGNITNRPNRIRKRAVIFPGSCLDITARLPGYRSNARQAAREATNELARIFEENIKEFLANPKESDYAY